MSNFGMSMMWFWICYILVTCVGIMHTVFNIYVLKMKPMDENGMGEGYEKTKPWHPLYNIILFSVFGWLYMNGLDEPIIGEALTTGAIWAGICIVFDVFGWVLIKHPWSLSFKEFYVDYQPWITLIYLAIFAGPVVGYLLLFQNIVFQIFAVVIMAVFYGVYLGKMIMQKHQGIKTDQIATKNKKGKVYAIELIMKIATYAVVLIEIISIILNTHLFPQPIRIPGIAIAVLGDIVFATAVYTMHDSWRAGIAKDDKTSLVTSGIYSISRNPAFLGFYLVYIGVLMMFFNRILFVVTVFAITMLHLQVLQEEKHLADVFGNEYITYKNKVKRYFTLLQNNRLERVKDLISRTDFDDVIDIIKLHYGDKEINEQKELYKKLKFMEANPNKNGTTIFINAFLCLDDDKDDICVVDFDEMDTKLCFDVSAYEQGDDTVYSIVGVGYKDLLGFYIDAETKNKFSDKSILAHVLWEVTGFSYEDAGNN